MSSDNSEEGRLEEGRKLDDRGSFPTLPEIPALSTIRSVSSRTLSSEGGPSAKVGAAVRATKSGPALVRSRLKVETGGQPRSWSRARLLLAKSAASSARINPSGGTPEAEEPWITQARKEERVVAYVNEHAFFVLPGWDPRVPLLDERVRSDNAPDERESAVEGRNKKLHSVPENERLRRFDGDVGSLRHAERSLGQKRLFSLSILMIAALVCVSVATAKLHSFDSERRCIRNLEDEMDSRWWRNFRNLSYAAALAFLLLFIVCGVSIIRTVFPGRRNWSVLVSRQVLLSFRTRKQVTITAVVAALATFGAEMVSMGLFSLSVPLFVGALDVVLMFSRWSFVVRSVAVACIMGLLNLYASFLLDSANCEVLQDEAGNTFALRAYRRLVDAVVLMFLFTVARVIGGKFLDTRMPISQRPFLPFLSEYTARHERHANDREGNFDDTFDVMYSDKEMLVAGAPGAGGRDGDSGRAADGTARTTTTASSSSTSSTTSSSSPSSSSPSSSSPSSGDRPVARSATEGENSATGTDVFASVVMVVMAAKIFTNPKNARQHPDDELHSRAADEDASWRGRWRVSALQSKSYLHAAGSFFAIFALAFLAVSIASLATAVVSYSEDGRCYDYLTFEFGRDSLIFEAIAVIPLVLGTAALSVNFFRSVENPVRALAGFAWFHLTEWPSFYFAGIVVTIASGLSAYPLSIYPAVSVFTVWLLDALTVTLPRVPLYVPMATSAMFASLIQFAMVRFFVASIVFPLDCGILADGSRSSILFLLSAAVDVIWATQMPVILGYKIFVAQRPAIPFSIGMYTAYDNLFNDKEFLDLALDFIDEDSGMDGDTRGDVPGDPSAADRPVAGPLSSVPARFSGRKRAFSRTDTLPAFIKSGRAEGKAIALASK